jgi:DNA recombination protein RmuC
LGKLGKDFNLFDQRLGKLADHIRQAHEDTEKLRITGDKLTRRFGRIEKVELDQPDQIRDLQQSLLDVPQDQEEEAGREEPRS